MRWYIWCTIPPNDLTVAKLNEQVKRAQGPNEGNNCYTGRTMLATLRAYAAEDAHWSIRACVRMSGVDTAGHTLEQCRAYIFQWEPVNAAEERTLFTPLPVADAKAAKAGVPRARRTVTANAA